MEEILRVVDRLADSVGRMGGTIGKINTIHAIGVELTKALSIL